MVSGSAHACRREAADIGKNKINILLIPVVIMKNLLIPEPREIISNGEG